MPLGKLVIAFAHLVPAALLDPFGKVKGGNHRPPDLGSDPEQAEREALCMLRVGLGSPLPLPPPAAGTYQPTPPTHPRERAARAAIAFGPHPTPTPPPHANKHAA